MKKNFNIQDRADVEDQRRLNEMSLALTDTRMTNLPTFPEKEMRSDHENEDIQAEDHKMAKSVADQVAKTSQGRAMQLTSEERIEEIDAHNADNYFEFEPTRNEIAILLEDGHLTVSEEGDLQLNESLSSNDLSAVREALLDLKLPTDKKDRELVQSQVGVVLKQIQAKITPKASEKAQKTENQPQLSLREKVNQAKENLTRALRKLSEVQTDIRMAIREKKYYVLNTLNQEAILAALDVLDQLEKIRSADPDSLVDLAHENNSFENSYEPVGDVLTQFVRTHNSFSLSPQVEKELASLRLQEYRNGQIGKPSFVGSFLGAYNAPKAQDDPIEFLRKTTRIPAKRFDRIMEHIMKQN